MYNGAVKCMDLQVEFTAICCSDFFIKTDFGEILSTCCHERKEKKFFQDQCSLGLLVSCYVRIKKFSSYEIAMFWRLILQTCLHASHKFISRQRCEAVTYLSLFVLHVVFFSDDKGQDALLFKNMPPTYSDFSLYKLGRELHM